MFTVRNALMKQKYVNKWSHPNRLKYSRPIVVVQMMSKLLKSTVIKPRTKHDVAFRHDYKHNISLIVYFNNVIFNTVMQLRRIQVISVSVAVVQFNFSFLICNLIEWPQSMAEPLYFQFSFALKAAIKLKFLFIVTVIVFFHTGLYFFTFSGRVYLSSFFSHVRRHVTRRLSLFNETE